MTTDNYSTLITADQLLAIHNLKDTVILDCRFDLTDAGKGRKQYMADHIPGAYYFDLDFDLASPVIKGVTGRHPLPHPELLSTTLRAAGLNDDSQVVVYDQANGMYAARAWWLLRWLGHDRVALLDGGYQAWTEQHFPIDNAWTPPRPGLFSPILNTQLLVEREEIASTRPKMLVDSRDRKRYTGEVEPIDPVGGHIDGAICIPFAENTDKNGRWKSIEALRVRFENNMPSAAVTPIFYCGSGVTACHNILAYKIATGIDARLYAGSWSEWLNYYPPVTGDFPTFDPTGGNTSPVS